MADRTVTLSFEVRDTGVGIPADKLQMIFEGFSQVDSSTTRRYGGTGLGLAISRQLIALMGGRTWVESELGKGSIFHFVVPLRLSGEEPLQKPQPLEPLEGVPVLVVDDNRTNRLILEEILTGWGMQPVVADSSASALDRLNRAAAAKPFRLVLLDTTMPEMDSFTLARRIRESPAHAECALILLTTADQSLDGSRCHELSIAGCLLKPVRQSDLFDLTLRAVVGPHGVQYQPVTEAAPVGEGWSLRILLAEDVLINQQVAVGLLQMRGHGVVVTNNGKEAIAALQREPFDLVLMDVQMPEMDGLEAAAAIRQQESGTGRHVPIIAMTAHAMKGDRERCLQAGMDDYVSKPVRARELFEAIARVVPASRPPESPTNESPPATEIFNPEVALNQVGGNRELLRELAGLFPEECRRLLAEVHAAIAERNAGRLGKASHSLKGVLATFGAQTATAVALRLETMGRRGNLDGIESVSTALDQEIARLLPALAGFAAQTSPPGRSETIPGPSENGAAT